MPRPTPYRDEFREKPGDHDGADPPAPRRYGDLAPITVQMLTPRGIVAALSLMGWRWRPTAIIDHSTHNELGATAGLFCWVDGLSDSNRNPLRSAVLYVGIGEGRGGVAVRVNPDYPSYRGLNPTHATTLHRRRAVAVAGPVDTADSPTANGVLPAFITDKHDAGTVRMITAWLARQSTLACARHIAIRLTAHLGDTVAFANSHHAARRAQDSGGDWCAAAIAEQLLLQPPVQHPPPQ